MKKALKVLAIVAAVLALVFFGGLFIIRSQAQKALATLTYEKVDMSNAADGDYEALANAGILQVRVKVTVKDHAIAGIAILTHNSGMGQKAEAITAAMVSANTFQVDAVSGATLSSEAIKSAVSKALNKSCQQ